MLLLLLLLLPMLMLLFAFTCIRHVVALFCEFHSFRHLFTRHNIHYEKKMRRMQYTETGNQINEHVCCYTALHTTVHSAGTRADIVLFFSIFLFSNNSYSSTFALAFGLNTFAFIHKTAPIAHSGVCREGISGQCTCKMKISQQREHRVFGKESMMIYIRDSHKIGVNNFCH